MIRLFKLAAIAVLLCFPVRIVAQYHLMELGDVQVAKSLGATMQDPTGAPVRNAVVEEFSGIGKRCCVQARPTAMVNSHSLRKQAEESISFRFPPPALIRCVFVCKWTPNVALSSN
jgi:hypothetical protein